MSADDRAGVHDGVAADFDIVADHGTELFDAGLDVFIAVVDDDQLLVGLDVRRDGAGSGVGVIPEDGVADIVVVRGLDVVEQDDVLQFAGVADDAVGTDECGAADECAVANFGLGPDDAGRSEVCGREHRCRLVDPHMLLDFFIVVTQRRAEFEDEVLDALQGFPGVGELFEIFFGQRVVKVIKVFDGIHKSSFSFLVSTVSGQALLQC